MDLRKYEVEASSSFLNYEFISKGPKGHIKKKVIFRQVDDTDVFNLGFGDVDEVTGEIDDVVITNNADTLTVMATVAHIVVEFFEKYPDKHVFAIGSTASRTRLYEMGIVKYLPEILVDFQVFGYLNKEWQLFEIGVRYQAFLVRKKNVNL